MGNKIKGPFYSMGSLLLPLTGLFNNTLVIYILGDNGASAEGLHGTIDELLAETG